MSEECKKHRAAPIVGPHDCPSCAMEKIRGVNYELSVENQRLREQAEALRALALEIRQWLVCDDVNHQHGELHDYADPCPALARFDAALKAKP